MNRTKGNKKQINSEKGLALLQRSQELLSRASLARKMGWQYEGDRKLYEALGYPTEKELTFSYYFSKYERQDIASAIIDRPVNATWDGPIVITEEGAEPKESKLNIEWKALEDKFKVKSRLVKLDKLSGIGRFGILLFGFSDVKEVDDYKKPANGKQKLIYLRQFSEASVTIETWETNTSKERYGLPLFYKIQVESTGTELTKDLIVHHSRVIHVLSNNLLSEVYGQPRLKPIANRLEDLEKLLGGDAEMFWRGARPGYHAAAQENYEMGDDEIEALQDELDKYEHDLRRFISAKGVDIKALDQQIADPGNHVDIQIQAISAQTSIPKRVLVGSERGELASSQDKDQWLTLIQSRMTEFAEPNILRPFINKCMEHGILSKVAEYFILWADIFAPSEKQKAEVGEIRAKAMKAYADSLFASEILPPKLAYKILLGLTEEQSQELIDEVGDVNLIEDAIIEEEENEEGE